MLAFAPIREEAGRRLTEIPSLYNLVSKITESTVLVFFFS